jgi:Tfp pilus assembly protein PilV
MMTASGRSVRVTVAPPSSARGGFTIIEVLVSCVMLLVAVSALLGSSGAVAREVGGGNAQTLAATMAQARLDSLTSLGCAQLQVSGGSRTFRGVDEVWTVTDGRNIKTLDVRLTVPRRTNQLRYRMVVPCRD